MIVSVIYDKLLNAYYVYDTEAREILAGSDNNVIWDNIKDLPEEFYGSSHCYTIDEVDFTLVKE